MAVGKKQPPGGGGCKGSSFGQSTIPVSSSIDPVTGVIHPGLSKGCESWLKNPRRTAVIEGDRVSPMVERAEPGQEPKS